MMKNLRIGMKLAIGFGTLLSLLIAASVAGWWGVRQVAGSLH